MINKTFVKVGRAALFGSALVLSMSQADAAKVAKKVKAPAKEEVMAEEVPLESKLVVDAPAQSLAANNEVIGTPILEQASEPLAAENNVAGAATETFQAEPAAPAPTKAQISKMPENEIPVLANSKEVKKAESNGMTRIMITLGVLATALGAATFGLKRWAAKSQGKQKNTRIKVLTQHALGPKKSLVIVQVAGESILIGVTDQNISMLKTLSLIDDEVPEQVPNNFDSALDSVEDAGGEEESFAMHGIGEIRDVVSKRMRRMKDI